MKYITYKSDEGGERPEFTKRSTNAHAQLATANSHAARGPHHRDPFDKMYPITEMHNGPGMEYTVYLLGPIEMPYEFAEILELLASANPEDRIIFVINSPGGYLHSTITLIDAIKHCKANTVAECSGLVASAATMIALACEGLYVGEHVNFMIHNYSGGLYGKGGEIKADYEFSKKHKPEFFHSVYEHFLTYEECEHVIDDHDLYLTTEEVKERWMRVIKFKEGEMRAEQEAEMEESKLAAIENLKALGYKVTKSRPKKQA